MKSPIENRLKTIAKTAGRMILERSVTRIEEKEGHANFVTDIDKALQAYLDSALTELVPGSRIIGEEDLNSDLTGEPTWIVDPVDGTTNLIHDYHWSAVSIALLKNETPVVGLIYQPYTDELFYAEKGEGAELNGQSIRVAGHSFEHALVAFGTAPYYPELSQKSMRLAWSFLKSCSDIRRPGSAAMDLAYLACGRIDIFFELYLKPWDYAAGSLLITEAGGEFRMPLCDTGVAYGQSTAILAAAPGCIEQAEAMFIKEAAED